MSYGSIGGVTPATPRIGAFVEGVTLANPLSNRQVEELHQAAGGSTRFLFFRDQPMDVDAHKRFGRYFGELHIHPQHARTARAIPRFCRSMPDANSKRNINGEYWHSDVSLRRGAAGGPASSTSTRYRAAAARYDLCQPVRRLRSPVPCA